MVYVLEDDKAILDIVLYALKSQNIEAKGFSEFTQLESALKDSIPQILVLDCLLPGMNGFEILQRIKSNPNTQKISVLMLTALDSEIDKVKGLDYGADDYITKPFSLTEVVARIRANIRRNTRYAQASAQEETKKLICGALVMDTEAYTVAKNGVLLDLTAREYEILKLLLKHPKKVYTKEQIYNQVWKDAYLGDENAVNVHISRLRAKVEDAPRKPVYIQTVWGIGYKLGEAGG